ARREGLDPEDASALVLRQPQLDAARAALQSAEARLEDARLALDRTWVRAPFDGIVRDESLDVGQYVAPGQGNGRIYGTGSVEIVVPMSDDRASRIDALWRARAGDESTRIQAWVEAEYGGDVFEWGAFVDRAEAALDERTRTVDVVLKVPAPFEPTEEQPDRPPLLIGTYATVDIVGTEFDEYAIVPSAALRDGEVVWTLQADTLLVMKQIQVIQEVEELAYVTGDLRDGEPVIVSGLPFVTDGMTVRDIGTLETSTSDGTPPSSGEPGLSADPAAAASSR
ncbi:MAG: efflux RND transporter periplasmic adaptor subunit, partial [Gemmatimonadota bacterium]|nr:efflux RND transporter periplasmic adaptor subunit [Gemmatimonadota bacterium]